MSVERVQQFVNEGAQLQDGDRRGLVLAEEAGGGRGCQREALAVFIVEHDSEQRLAVVGYQAGREQRIGRRVRTGARQVPRQALANW